VKISSDPIYDPNVVFCEDFEKASLDQNGGPGWADTYGPPVNGCFVQGQWKTTMEGTCPTCCLNVVKENACEVSGQTDCVFQGGQTMGHRFRPGQEGGIVGGGFMSSGTHFGVTMAVKFSRNFVNGNSPKKTNEFGERDACMLGCSSGTIVPMQSGNPYHGFVWLNSTTTTYQTVVGQGHTSGSVLRWAPRVPQEYDFDRDFGLDRWHCRRFHIANVGTTNATIRDWMDDRLVVHLKNVDLRSMVSGSGISEFSFNNYTNNGYTGSNVAYRYEDNMVITRGAEPVSCAAIGFGGTLPPPPPPDELGAPGQPVIINP
jgi:hypothetical protein